MAFADQGVPVRHVLEPLREIVRALMAATGGESSSPTDGPPPRRGAVFVLVQAVAVAAVAALTYGIKVLVAGAAAQQLALGVAALVLAVPLVVNWLADPPGRDRALVVGLGAGLAAALAVLASSGSGPWAMFLVLAAGFVTAAVVFAAVSVGA